MIWYAVFFLDGIFKTILIYSNYRVKIGDPVFQFRYQQPNQMWVRHITGFKGGGYFHLLVGYLINHQGENADSFTMTVFRLSIYNLTD